MKLHTVWLLAGAALLNGCATFIHGPYQDVTIDSSPPGATATVSPMLSERGPAFLDPAKQVMVTTPATIRLRRDNTYRVELAKAGYKLTTTQVVSNYDWLWAPVVCGPCEAFGEIPYVGRPARALGRGFRLFSPEALLGTSFKLKPADGALFSDWHALGTPHVSATLQPSGG